MTIIAGVVVLKGEAELFARVRDYIRKSISRVPTQIAEFGDRNCFLAKVDVGAYGAPAAHADPVGNVSLLAGEPLMRVEGDGPVPDREADLARLHEQWVRSDWSGLDRSTGTFCAVHWRAGKREIALISDKLGVRPIYYWRGKDLVIFATALRILEAIPSVPLDMDLRGTTETAAFAFPLGERTAYKDISTIGAGQVVQIAADGAQKLDYWRWDRLDSYRRGVPQVAADCYRAFHSAIRRRLHGSRTAVAFLSGGLDSRAIASALLEQGLDVHTLNFAWEGTQDYVFASEAAKALGSRHHQLGVDLKQMYAFRGRVYNQTLVT